MNKKIANIFESGTRWLPDEYYLKLKFRKRMGYSLDIDNPTTFNEKLQWLKLNDHNPKYINLVDKIEMKKIISRMIGEKYVVPIIDVWDSFDKISFDKLPNQFVLKCSHDSGGLVICKDKKNFNREQAKKIIDGCLKKNYYWHGREWPYKGVVPRVFAEQYIENEDKTELIDYKIFCFNGVPEIVLVCQNRFSGNGLLEDFYSVNWQHLPIKRPKHDNSTVILEKPTKLSEMLELSKLITRDMPFCRIDFYQIGELLYVGEVTFYPASGFSGFEPKEVDLELGKKIDLSLAYRRQK